MARVQRKEEGIEPEVDWKLLVTGELPMTQKELELVIEQCEAIEKWKPAGINRPLRIEDIRAHSQSILVKDGRMMWDSLSIQLYGRFRKTMISHLDA